jgi:hypothetical protein
MRLHVLVPQAIAAMLASRLPRGPPPTADAPSDGPGPEESATPVRVGGMGRGGSVHEGHEGVGDCAFLPGAKLE